MCRLGSFTSSKLLGMMLCCSLIDFNSTVILTEVKTVIKTVVRISLTAYHCSSDFCLFLQKWQQSTQMYIIRVIVKRYKHTYYAKNERKKIDTRELYPNWMKSILHLIVHTHTHPFNGPLSGTTWVGWYQKGKPIWILLKEETVSGSGIS